MGLKALYCLYLEILLRNCAQHYAQILLANGVIND